MNKHIHPLMDNVLEDIKRFSLPPRPAPRNTYDRLQDGRCHARRAREGAAMIRLVLIGRLTLRLAPRVYCDPRLPAGWALIPRTIAHGDRHVCH